MKKYFLLFIVCNLCFCTAYCQISNFSRGNKDGSLCPNESEVYYEVTPELDPSSECITLVPIFKWEISPANAGKLISLGNQNNNDCDVEVTKVEWDLNVIAKGGVKLKATVDFGYLPSYGVANNANYIPCSSYTRARNCSYSYELDITFTSPPKVTGGKIVGPDEILTSNSTAFRFLADTEKNVKRYQWRLVKDGGAAATSDGEATFTKTFTYLDNGSYTLTCIPLSGCDEEAGSFTKTLTINIPTPVERQPCQDIDSEALVTLAPSSEAVYLIVGEGCQLTVESCTGIVISEDVVLEDGAVISASIGGCEVPDNATLDNDRNWVMSRAFDEQGKVIAEGKSFFDALGRPTQSQVKNLTEQQVLAVQTLYDMRGQGTLSTLPAPINNRSFAYHEGFMLNQDGKPYTAADFDSPTRVNNPRGVADYIAGTVGYYYGQYNQTETHVPVTAYPFARSWTPATPDPTISISSGPGEAHRMGSGHELVSERVQVYNDAVLTHYYALRKHFVTETTPMARTSDGYRFTTTDANGKQSISYVDAVGRAVVSGVANEAGGYDYSYGYYDAAGRMVASIAPKGVDQSTTAYPGFVSLYQYDGWGRLWRSTSPDEGSSEYVYSQDGKLRFSQSSEQRAPSDGSAPRFSYTNYDAQHRLVESGEYVMGTATSYRFDNQLTQTPAAGSILHLSDQTGAAGDVDAKGKQHVRRIYYDTPSQDFAPDGLHASQQFVYGRVAKTAGENSVSYYSYDVYGRLVWMVQDITGLGRKSVDYSYDLQGKVVAVAYQQNQPDAFYHYYSFDADQRLAQVHTSRDGKDKVLQASYEYYLHGPLKRVALAEKLQGIDYVYTIQGALKGINHADAGQDPGGDGDDVFGMSLHYYSGDYTGACDDAGVVTGLEVEQQYGGALQAISWHSPAEEHQTKAYQYRYDSKYQLLESSWGEVNLQSDGSYSFTASTSFTESIQSYDAHGNIEGLQRTGKQGSLIANYGYYHYGTGNNELLNIRSSKEATINLRKYEYNKVGQLVSEQQQAGQSKYLQYDAYGQVIAVYADAGKTMPLVKYAYNDQGYQVLKKHYNEQGQAEKDTWYVRDASGSVLSIYEEDIVAKQPLSQIEFPVYAQGRLGMLSTRGNDEVYQYELSDHIGNVRAVISRQRQADGSIDVLHYRDYYSFGSVIEDNSRALGSYRYGYQGLYSEEDEKTSWHSFELRQYDSDIGRWNSIDPYGQYHSPYVAMGNAPNMMVDMDGGWSGGPVGSKISFVKNVVDWARVGKFALNYALPAAASVGRSYEGLNNLKQQNATLIQSVQVDRNRGLGELSPNSAYTERGNDVNGWDLFNEFLNGTGPEYSIFNADHPMTQDMKNSWIVGIANAKYALEKQEPLIRYDAPFGLLGIPMAWSGTEQIIGGARVSIIPVANGRIYVVDNTMDRYSYHLHMDQSIPRVPGINTLQGTTYHRFVWFQSN